MVADETQWESQHRRRSERPRLTTSARASGEGLPMRQPAPAPLRTALPGAAPVRAGHSIRGGVFAELLISGLAGYRGLRRENVTARDILLPQRGLTQKDRSLKP